MKINIKETKLMVSGTKEETSRSKIDPYDTCGKRVMANFILCTKCSCRVHRSCTKRKKLLLALGQSFVCARCSSVTPRIEANKEKLCDDV